MTDAVHTHVTQVCFTKYT